MKCKIVLDSYCEECQEDVESSGHLFWECPRAREIWALSNLFPVKKELQFHSFIDLLWHSMMVAKWDQETLEKIIVISWKLWTYRNEVRNGGVTKNERAIITGALDYLGEYQFCVAITTRQEEKGLAVWSPPPPPTNLYKTNVGGAVFAAQRVTGVGVLIREWQRD